MQYDKLLSNERWGEGMLHIARSLRELHFGKLMEVYMEGNMENAQEFWPDLPAGQKLLRAEQQFYQYLQEGFFSLPGAVYAIWQEDGNYVSALRLEPYKDGWLLEALETAPGHRRRGYAGRLITEAVAKMGLHKVYSHVGKKNAASLAVHKSCGFAKILDYAAYIDGSVDHRAVTLCLEQKQNEAEKWNAK